MSEIPLSNIVAALREEIEVARSKAEKKDLKFSVKDIELELSVVIKEDKNAKFGVSLFGVDVGVGGQHSESITHRVKLKLDPKVKGPEGPQNPEISNRGDF